MTAAMLAGCSPEGTDGLDSGLDDELGVQEQGAGTTGANRLKVWTFNTHQNSFGENGTDARQMFAWMCSSSRQYRPDLIFLQENNNGPVPTYGWHTMTEVLNEIRGKNGCDWNYATTTLSVRGGTAIIYRTSRFDLVTQDINAQWIWENGVCALRTTGAVNVKARFYDKLRGQYLNVASVHNDRGESARYCSELNEKQLRDDLYAYGGSGNFYTAIIAGDFNTSDTQQWWYNMGASTYNDAIYRAGPVGEARHTVADGRRIDFIWTRNGSFENANTKQSTDFSPPASDHAAVTAAIILP
jgi:endonuclease/exonuclease/phosphatase family metal-dependent hydrolase